MNPDVTSSEKRNSWGTGTDISSNTASTSDAGVVETIARLSLDE
jgi:hypothetical protein